LVTFAVRSNELEQMSKEAQQLGLTVLGPYEGSRLQPDGATLRWRTLELQGHHFGNYLPFFIDWQDSPHPASFLPAQAAVESFVLQHPAQELAILYELFEIPVNIRPGPEKMTLTLRTRTGVEALEGHGKFDLFETRETIANSTAAGRSGSTEDMPI
jgi:hypothetical protein